MTDDKYMNDKEVAAYTGIKVSTLNWWRQVRKGPRFFQPSRRITRYLKSDIDAWMFAAQKETRKAS